jgi:hypothetical protein
MIPLMLPVVTQIQTQDTQRLQAEAVEDGKILAVLISELTNELNKSEEITLRKKTLDLLLCIADTIPIELKAEEAGSVDFSEAWGGAYLVFLEEFQEELQVEL